jgi:integrase
MPRGERGTSRPYRQCGSKIWWIRYKVPGEPKERRESSESTDKEVARRLLNQRRKEIDERKVSTTDANVSDLLQLYLSDQKRQSRHSYQQAEGYVRLHLKPALGPIQASKLASHHIECFIDQKQAAKYANATINRWLEALRRSYTLGMERLPPLVYVAPNIKALMLEEDNVREGFLEHEEYIALRTELPDHQRLILVIGYHFGMRRGEILKLRWDQVDWDGNLIRLEKRQTKGKKARVAPLYGELRGWLEMAFAARDPECPFIVSWKGHGIREVKTAWQKARVRAGVPELLIHDLRRTAARNMIRGGVPEKLVLDIVGWKTRAMLDRYNITDERDVQAAGEKMTRFHEEKARLAAEREIRMKVRIASSGEERFELAKGQLIQ